MALRSLSAQRGFCYCAALRKFCPSFLLHCSLSLWDGLLQMVPVPDYFMSCICPFTLRKPTAVAIVPEKLVNASNRKTFSPASIEWSKLAWHLLASLDYCASQAGSVLKPSFGRPASTLEHRNILIAFWRPWCYLYMYWVSPWRQWLLWAKQGFPSQIETQCCKFIYLSIYL